MNKKIKIKITKLLIIFAIFIIIGLIIGYGCGYFFNDNEYIVTLNGDSIVEINSASDYQELGVTLKVNGKRINSNNIEIIGEVKDEAGTYIISYHINDKKLDNIQLQRIVIIKGDN